MQAKFGLARVYNKWLWSKVFEGKEQNLSLGFQVVKWVMKSDLEN